MKMTVVKHNHKVYVTNIPVDEITKKIAEASKNRDSFEEAIKHLQTRWIFEEARTVEVM